MARSLKLFGIAALALTAALAVTATPSLAGEVDPAVITADEYPAFADGEELEKLLVIKGSRTTTCENYEGSASIEEPSTTATVSGALLNCHTIIFGSTLPITVTTNECSLVFHLSAQTEPTAYTVLADLECPEGKVVETHVYSNMTKHEANEPVCTQTIPPQEGLEGIELENVAGEPDYVVAKVEIEEITSVSHGSMLICGAEHGPSTLIGELKLSATNEVGEPIGATISAEEP